MTFRAFSTSETIELPARLTPVERLTAATAASCALSCRILNVGVALALIALTLPLFAVIALAVRLSSPGPVLYRQVRIGWNRRARRQGETWWSAASRGSLPCGRPFTMYKFRTMRHSADTPQVWASRTDPRITAVGRVLRRLRLDELPQLFNVLIGDMNVVGPRPEQPEIVRQLQRQIRDYPDRQCVPPGITGLAQISLAYDATLEDVRKKVALDLEYVRRRSPLEDLRIMLRTPLVMIGGRGAV